MKSGKLGRPPEDRLARQREIYDAVAPLLLTRGARGLALDEAARAACLSIGGLYHYFPTKRDLVLYGVQVAAIDRYCQDFLTTIAPLASHDPRRYLGAYLDHSMGLIAFMRPAFQVALELGVETVRETVEISLGIGMEQCSATLRRFVPEIDEAALATLAQAIRRLCLGALLDRGASAEELSRQVRLLVNACTGNFLGETPPPIQAVAD